MPHHLCAPSERVVASRPTAWSRRTAGHGGADHEPKYTRDSDSIRKGWKMSLQVPGPVACMVCSEVRTTAFCMGRPDAPEQPRRGLG